MVKDTTKQDTTKDLLNKGQEDQPKIDQGVETPSGGDSKPSNQEETNVMAKAPQWGGFKVEVGVAAPKTGSSKYDWASFPAPSDPNDPTTWPSVFIPDIGGKTIYSSIKTYRDKIQKEGGRAPEFTVSVSKDPKGVRVIRKS